MQHMHADVDGWAPGIRFGQHGPSPSPSCSPRRSPIRSCSRTHLLFAFSRQSWVPGSQGGLLPVSILLILPARSNRSSTGRARQKHSSSPRCKPGVLNKVVLSLLVATISKMPCGGVHGPCAPDVSCTATSKSAPSTFLWPCLITMMVVGAAGAAAGGAAGSCCCSA